VASALSPAFRRVNEDITRLIEGTHALLYVATFDINKLPHRGGKGDLGKGQFGPVKPENPLPPLVRSEGKEDDSAEKEQIQIEKQDLATKLELYRLDIAARKDADDEKVASGKLTKSQEIADLTVFLKQQQAMSLQALDDQMELWDEDTAE